MTGQVKFNTGIISNNTTAIMKLRSRNDNSKHTVFTGGVYSVSVYFCCMHVHSTCILS